MSSKIRGVVPPLAIPLKDGELDVPSLERHINRLIEAGLDQAVDVTLERGDVELAVLERNGQGRHDAADLRRHNYFSPSRLGCRSEGAAPRSLRV